MDYLSNVTNRLIENKQSEVRADYYEDVAYYGGREVLVKNAYAFFKKSVNWKWIEQF